MQAGEYYSFRTSILNFGEQLDPVDDRRVVRLFPGNHIELLVVTSVEMIPSEIESFFVSHLHGLALHAIPNISMTVREP